MAPHSQTELARGERPCRSAAWAVSLLAWCVFAPQCLSTLVTGAPRDQFLALSVLMTGYLFAMAYGFALVTYQIAHALSA